jgi:hypothetical protein
LIAGIREDGIEIGRINDVIPARAGIREGEIETGRINDVIPA